MSNQPNWEGRPIAHIRDLKSGEVVGFVVLTDAGDIARLWLGPQSSSFTVEALPGENISTLDLDL